MSVAKALASLKLGFQLDSGASTIAGITKDAFNKLVFEDVRLGNVYRKVREWKDQRAIRCDVSDCLMKQSEEIRGA